MFKQRVEFGRLSQADDLRAALKECRAVLPRIAILGFFSNCLIITPSIFVMQLYDRVITSGRVESLFLLLLIATACVAFMGFFDAIRQLLLNRISGWLDQRLTATLIASSVKATLLGVPPSAQPLQDLNIVRTAIGGPVMLTLTDMLFAPIFIFIAWLLHPVFGIIGLVSICFSITLVLITARISQRSAQAGGQNMAANSGRAETAVRNADVFQALGMMPAFIAQWNARNAEAVAAQEKASTESAILMGFSRFTRMLVQLLIMATGAYLVIIGEVAGGSLMASSMLLYRALGPVEQAVGSWKQVATAREAYKRLSAVLSLVPSVEETMSLPKPQGYLSCEGLTYMLAGRPEPILNGLTFKLQPGEVLGIIGPSASGKSTLCRLLIGLLRPVRGSVRLDGADVFAWPSDELGPSIGFLPQEVELFEGTVRENIARLEPDADAEDVVEAAKAAGAHELILRLPDGYETEVGVRGARLSGGQRQRIALARALFRRPTLIVLDEPNANLDGEGEACLIAAINKAKDWGATVILVAHQPHIMNPANKLLVLRNGRAEMFGPRDDVLRELRAAQARRIGRQGAPEPQKPETVQAVAEGGR